MTNKLTGAEEGTFPFHTISHRLPDILTRALDTFVREWKSYDDAATGSAIKQHLDSELRSSDAKEVIGELSKLRYLLMTNKKLEPLNYENTPDYNQWMNELNKQEYFWFVSSWLFVECYLYRKIADIFLSSRYYKIFDPFNSQKIQSMLENINEMKVIAKIINKHGKLKSKADLVQWIELALWGNKCDLSLKSSTPDMDHIIDTFSSQRSKILVNDTQNLVDRIEAMRLSGKHNLVIDYVLDNAGFELFSDLCLLHAMTNYVGIKKIKSINIHVKCYPWFVSDVMKKDFYFMIDYLSGKIPHSSKPSAKDQQHDTYQHFPNQISKIDCKDLLKLGKEWHEHLECSKWIIVENYFWTSCFDFSSMKSQDRQLYDNLCNSSLIIFKGDLNYRKLLGDIPWPIGTTTEESFQEFKPSFVATLRTNKAPLISGLDKETFQSDKLPDDYLTSGEYAVIQTCDVNAFEL